MENILFSDESHFMLLRADERSRIYLHHNEGYAANYVLEHDCFSGSSVMVLAGIHHGHTAMLS